MFSAVCARQGDGSLKQPVDPDRIMVRARDRMHLEMLRNRFQGLQEHEIHESVSNDYRFRFFVSKAAWAAVMAELVLDVDYDNFKREVGRYQGKSGAGYKAALSRVWATLYSYQSKLYGPGIYDRPEALAEPEDEQGGLWTDDEVEDCKPDHSDQVLLIVDGDDGGKIIGAIWWPDNFGSSAEAYSAAVEAGVLTLVGHPEYRLMLWGDVQDENLLIYDPTDVDTPPTRDVFRDVNNHPGDLTAEGS